jgi:hypothetical protein
MHIISNKDDKGRETRNRHEQEKIKIAAAADAAERH